MTTRWMCGLCEVSPSRETVYGSRGDVVAHIKEHGTSDIDLYLTEATEQTTLC